MKTKIVLILIVCLTFFTVKSQTNLNHFKYVIVPKKFDFLKKADQYQMNSLTKYLLEKENFIAFFDDEAIPEDLAKNRCLALNANVIDESGLLKTKLKLQLKDCRNSIVFESRIGDSKLKAYEKAYQQSIREAFQSLESLNYVYKPKSGDEVVYNTINDALKPAKKDKETDKMVDKVKKKKVENDIQPKPSVKPTLNKSEKTANSEKKELVREKIEMSDPNTDVLYAQTINNGFQLVDRTPKVVYTIYNSGKKDIYIVKGKDALIYKLNDIWVISEMVNETLKTQNINIKF